jgi:hypothetical protein
LELVLSLPILTLLAASIFTIGWVSLRRSGGATKARNDAWQKRLSPATTGKDASQPLALTSQSTSGAVLDEESDTFSIPSWLGGSATTKSSNTVLAGSWDYREIPDFNGSGPHLGVLITISENSILGFWDIGSLDSLAQLVELGIADLLNLL